MKRFVFALAAGGLFASAVDAQTSPPPVVTTPAPVVGAAPAVIGSPLPASDVFTSAPTTATRRGLFGRIRSRGTSGTVFSAAPVTVPFTPGTVITNPGTVIPAPMTTPGTAVPSPMPPVAPAPRNNGTSSAMPTVVGNPVVVASGTTGGCVTPAGGVATTEGGVTPAGGVVVDANGTVVPVAGTTAMPMTVMGNGMMAGGAMTTSAPMMMTSTTTTTTSTGRMGLIARIRARR